MANVKRRYVRNHVSVEELDGVVQLGASVDASNPYFADITVDDSTPGVEDAADSYMADNGFSFLGIDPGVALINTSQLATFQAQNAVFPSVAFASPGARADFPIVSFAPLLNTAALWKTAVPQTYGGGDVNVYIDWVAATAIAGNVEWGISVISNAPGSNIDTVVPSPETTVIAAADPVNGTVIRSTTMFVVPFSAGTLNTGDGSMFRIRRLGAGGNDNMLGAAQLLQVRVAGIA